MDFQQGYENQARQLVAVDCVIFGYEKGELKLLLFKRQMEPLKGRWSLIGGWVNSDETVEQAAGRVLLRITGLHDIFQEEVSVFSEPLRDPGGRVISVAYYALIDIEQHDKELMDLYEARWVPVADMPELILDHPVMVEAALKKLRRKASYELVGKDLLPEEFTITQLRQLYNSIFGHYFDPGNFRKKILSLYTLERTDRKDRSESRKGAFYYKFNNDSHEDIQQRIINN